ncbi:MAG: VWA domain-containing protein [Planctomycetota bacterium]
MPSPQSFIALLLATSFVVAPSAWAKDPLPLTGSHLLARIAQQPQSTRPVLFDVKEQSPKSKYQLAIVIDGTTSMKQELAELPRYLNDIANLCSHDVPENLQLAVVVYRDSRSPSGPVKIVSDFTSDINALRDKVRELKSETGEPYFPEAMDQGLHAALNDLSWSKPESNTVRRMLILGDAPPYANDHKNRKYHDSDLMQDIANRQIRIDAVLVNSGFLQKESGEVGTSHESATQAAPYAREFFKTLAEKTSGTVIDLWDTDQIASLQEPTIVLTGLAPAPQPKPLAQPTLDVWREFLSPQFSSVRTERPALHGLTTLLTIKPGSSVRTTTARQRRLAKVASALTIFPATWSAAELQSAIDDLELALEEEPLNAVLHFLLANTHALLATADAYEDHSQAVLKHVTQAHAGLTESVPPAVRQEIEALHALYVLGDRDAARQAFEKLNAETAESSNPGCRLRAAWSLLALESGFWPAANPPPTKPIKEKICQDLVRQILEQWPDSVEAQGLRKFVDAAQDNQIEISKSLFVLPRAR